MAALAWLRSDLRADDNAALSNACATDGAVHALFIATPEQWRRHQWGPRRRSFVLRSVAALGRRLDALGIPLHVLRVDDFAAVPAALADLCQEFAIDEVHASREYGVDELARDEAVAAELARKSLRFRCYDDATVLPPGSLSTGQGEPYRVYTPFRRAWLKVVRDDELRILPEPARRHEAAAAPYRDRVEDLDDGDLDSDWWPIGEQAAQDRLDRFVDGPLLRYHELRDQPAVDGTSRLSPYLASGVISVRRCFRAALDINQGEWDSGHAGVTTWLGELIWREFYASVLAGFPRVSRHRPMREETERIPWRDDPDALEAWRQGRTGIPLVDAGMRQLREVGWMHNRPRMVTAMFLRKHLLIDWRHGEAWFMEQLVDGDLAANNGGWQWSASTGTDAAPYFRVLSPLRQAERFDPDGVFQRRYIDELADVPVPALGQPGCEALLQAGYPEPIVDLKSARQRCIDTFKEILGKRDAD